jgi:hypothetical protein
MNPIFQPVFKIRVEQLMSLRPKPKSIYLTMEEVKGIVQAKDESRSIQTLADEQLIKEIERRGIKMTSATK